MSEFDLHMSRLYASLVGMNEADARLYRTMATTLQALHENTCRALKAYANAR